MATLQQLIRELEVFFVHSAMPQARFEVQWLVAQLLGIARYDFLLYPDREVAESDLERLWEGARRRLMGEPLAYICGSCEFDGLHLRLTRDVLIPRPESEELVQKLVEGKLLACSAARGLDLATGSGCLALALAKRLPSWHWSASDLSAAALAVAESNAKAHRMTLQLRCGSWLEPWQGERFDLIVCNPPYIASWEKRWIAGETAAFEPPLALFGGEDGLDPYRHLAAHAAEHLHEGGMIALEMGWDQAEALEAIFNQTPWCAGQVEQDLSGRARFFFAYKAARRG